ncbi:putative holin-like toxin [Carnobacterium maltaromaticum]|uniref:putative holin-like toxin n=1 Tax=Carnobacterium maltaromaticum TaxID=2751 RepID=UPI0039BDB2AC
MLMKISTKTRKGYSLLSMYEKLQLVLGIGMFILALTKLVVDVLKKDKKITAYFSE